MSKRKRVFRKLVVWFRDSGAKTAIIFAEGG